MITSFSLLCSFHEDDCNKNHHDEKTKFHRKPRSAHANLQVLCDIYGAEAMQACSR